MSINWVCELSSAGVIRQTARNWLVCACTALVLCLGLAPLPSRASDVDYPRSGLLDLSPQTYAVEVPRKIKPAPLPPSADSRLVHALAHDHVQYGLVPLHRMLPYGYGTIWTNRPQWADHAAMQSTSISPMAPIPATGVDDWSLGARNWRYVSSMGYGLTLGSTTAPALPWHAGDPTRLAGVGLYKALPNGDDADQRWQYAIAAGALDANGDGQVASGGLEYGPVAYDAATSYTVSPSLSIASKVQGTQGLLTWGLGGEYSLDQWGSWALGVSRARQPAGGGWGYQLAYKLNVLNDWDVAWAHEGRDAGYSDLSSYKADRGCSCVRNQWQLSMPMDRWGTLSGTYEQWDHAMGGQERQVGLAQDFWYGPFLNISLGLNRNLVSGDYGLGAQFSVSLD